MSTRAQIAIQTGPEEWAHVYVHFDGYPEHMLSALARWTPEDILAVRELRSVTVRRRMIWNRWPNSGADRSGSSGLGYAA